MSEVRQFEDEVAPDVMRQAAEWFVRLRTEDPTPEECSSWFAWIESDPAHRAAFARIQQSWDISGATVSPAWPTPEELALESVEASPARRFNWLSWGALAASVVAGVITFFQYSYGTERLSTGRGQQQTSVLTDGTRVELGGLTGVAVKYSKAQRLIVAGEGETYYRVARDPARPFVVQSGPVSIIALGTAFSVRREGDSVSVSVSEGLVEVRRVNPRRQGQTAAAVRAGAGERVRFESGEISRAGETAAASSWRDGRLRFEDEPLRVVVASVNRYSHQPIEIADPALGNLHFTGTVFDESIDRWLDSIEVIFPVEVRKENGRILIGPRPRS